MQPVDLLLLHPPSTYHSQHSFVLHNMLTASVPSTPAAENYPVGFLSIANYIEKNGFTAGIYNLALVNSVFPRMRPERLLPILRARIFGIDLHWGINTDGALQLAKTLKKSYPHSKILFGGLTASYFWQELLEHTEIDFVIRGDSAEYPILCLLQALTSDKNYSKIPNFAWKDSSGKIHENGISYVPSNLDEFPLDYGWLLRNAGRRKDPFGLLLSIPYRDWVCNPSAAIITQKGCPYHCVMCGGSAKAYNKICNRKKPAVKSPEAVIKDAQSAAELIRGQIFLSGDIRTPGEDYANEIFRLWKKSGIKNPLLIETLRP
ncbi:MAG: cobalamin-dependent protein, partial [Planctomycetota bacterium]